MNVWLWVGVGFAVAVVLVFAVAVWLCAALDRAVRHIGADETGDW